jgi:putative membrane protein
VELLAQDRYKQAVLLAVLVAFVASCIAPPYPRFLLMQHVPTLLGAIVLAYVSSRFAIGRASFTSISIFLCLHTLGARYLYSFTPYDAWSQQLLGVSVNETFGWTRNHFDRFVHFSYGLLMAVPIQEFERRHLRLSLLLSSLLAIECILATSALYEIVEWLVAVTFTPEWADQFLGQQGDIFDGQKDMALATAGSVLSIGLMALRERWRV